MSNSEGFEEKKFGRENSIKNFSQVTQKKLNYSIRTHILDVAEIAYLKLVAVATSNKYITIFSTITQKEVLKLSVALTGINMLSFFEEYQVLLIAGYEFSIPIFKVNHDFYDLEIVGRLKGHTSVVTALLPIKGTPVVVTCDDLSVVKTWHI